MQPPFSCYVGTALVAVRPFGLSNSVQPFIPTDRDNPPEAELPGDADRVNPVPTQTPASAGCVGVRGDPDYP